MVCLGASLTGPAANLLIGMTMGQLDDYAFLAACLSRRYDPPEREEDRAELRALKASKRIRRRVRGKPEKPGPARIHKRGPEHAGQSCGRAVQRRT